jgi:hypothetical protein
MKHFLLACAFVLFGVALQAQNHNRPDLSVYPNPVTDYISVNDHTDQVGFIVVFSLTGRKVKEFEFVKGDTYYVADLSKGMYLVQIQDRSRKILTTQKVDKR